MIRSELSSGKQGDICFDAFSKAQSWFCFHLHSLINSADKRARVSEEQQGRDRYSNSNPVSILELCASMQISREIQNAKSIRIFWLIWSALLPQTDHIMPAAKGRCL